MRLTQFITIVAAPAAVSSFVTTTTTFSRVPQLFRPKRTKWSRPLFSSVPGGNANDGSIDSDKDQADGLILDGLDQEMGKMASKFSFSESDFLAAARKRAEERVQSKNASAGDSDWQTLAEEKKTEYGEIDDWDNSMKEAGNQDSQILMSTDPTADGGDDGGEDAEPKLLLF